MNVLRSDAFFRRQAAAFFNHISMNLSHALVKRHPGLKHALEKASDPSNQLSVEFKEGTAFMEDTKAIYWDNIDQRAAVLWLDLEDIVEHGLTDFDRLSTLTEEFRRRHFQVHPDQRTWVMIYGASTALGKEVLDTLSMRAYLYYKVQHFHAETLEKAVGLLRLMTENAFEIGQSAELPYTPASFVTSLATVPEVDIEKALLVAQRYGTFEDLFHAFKRAQPLYEKGKIYLNCSFFHQCKNTRDRDEEWVVNLYHFFASLQNAT
ncbi:hypothetical protein V5O48_014709 [Marasmius crinis-equi]|uniref:Uncharacterized protein n=1 Tax=Marasmius crinis-equi TaxID=585013 RepID=A0ABR3EWJ8_9AGAR